MNKKINLIILSLSILHIENHLFAPEPVKIDEPKNVTSKMPEPVTPEKPYEANTSPAPKNSDPAPVQIHTQTETSTSIPTSVDLNNATVPHPPAETSTSMPTSDPSHLTTNDFSSKNSLKEDEENENPNDALIEQAMDSGEETTEDKSVEKVNEEQEEKKEEAESKIQELNNENLDNELHMLKQDFIELENNSASVPKILEDTAEKMGIKSLSTSQQVITMKNITNAWNEMAAKYKNSPPIPADAIENFLQQMDNVIKNPSQGFKSI